MKSIGFVPARCGSKEIPMKNIKSFCGKPLIYWSLKSLNDSELIHEVILATDCDEIERTALKFQFPKLQVYRRSLESAADHAATEEVMLEYITSKDLHENSLFVLAQATSPFTTSKDINQAIKRLKRLEADSLLSCVRTYHFTWSEDGNSLNYDFQNRPRRQDFRGNLQENGAIYISTIKQILESKNRLGGSIAIYEMPEFTSLELDKPYDWTIAEAIMKRYQSIQR